MNESGLAHGPRRGVYSAASLFPRPAMSRRIAIVEDEPAIRDNYADALKRHGYEVSTFPDRASATRAFANRLPELVLIDVGLGVEIDGGFTLCRDLRAMSSTLPVIFLTARDSDFDVVSGLRMGADDYVPKTVSLPHLIARIAALFRRADLADSPATLEDLLTRGALILDMKRMTVRWNNIPIELTLTELWMVHALARYPGHVKDRNALMREANIVVDDGTITSHIKRVRRKFQAADNMFEAIETVYGMGYRWHSPAD